MKFNRILFFIFFAMGLQAASSQTPASVFITAGQSNAEGRASSADKPAYLSKGYTYLQYAFIRSDRSGDFCSYEFGDTFSFCDVTNYFIDQTVSNYFYSIKCTYGGTSITPGQYDEKEADWKPVWYADSVWLSRNKAYGNNGGKSLTLSLIQGFSKCAETTLNKLQNGYDVKAIMWHQGESDRKKPDEYYKNFKEMITFMREQIYAVTRDEKDKELPFIFGTVPHASRQYNAIVEAAQYKVFEEIPNVFLIDLSAVSLKEDGIHFDGKGTETVGVLMYNELVELGLVSGFKIMNK